MTRPGPGGPSEGKVSFQVPLPLGEESAPPRAAAGWPPAPLRNTPRAGPSKLPCERGKGAAGQVGRCVCRGGRSATTNVLLGEFTWHCSREDPDSPFPPQPPGQQLHSTHPSRGAGSAPDGTLSITPRRHGRFWDGPDRRGDHDRSPHPERLPRQAAPAGRRCAHLGRANPGTRGRREPATAPAVSRSHQTRDEGSCSPPPFETTN